MRYGEGVFVGYRGYDALGRDVGYPFGHGLSYTTFAYSDLERRRGRVGTATRRRGHLRVTNTGARRGREVVQLYVGDPDGLRRAAAAGAQGASPRSTSSPGEIAAGDVPARPRATVVLVDARRGWVLEGGEFTIAVGASSRDLRLTSHRHDRRAAAARPARPPCPRSRSGSPTPTARALLREGRRRRRARGILGDAELVGVIGNFPIGRLAAFPGLGLDHGTVDELVRRRLTGPG